MWSSGNLSVKTLNDIVKKEHFVLDSEYLVTLIVAVPKYLLLYDIHAPLFRIAMMDWVNQYETLTQMVVPRSSQYYLSIYLLVGKSPKMMNLLFLTLPCFKELWMNSPTSAGKKSSLLLLVDDNTICIDLLFVISNGIQSCCLRKKRN